MQQRLLMFLLVTLWSPTTGRLLPAPDPSLPLRQVRVLAGGHSNHADGPGPTALFYWPSDVAIGPDGTLYVADTENHCIRKITPSGHVTTLAGAAGVEGYADGPSRTARFRRPVSLAVDAAGAVYVADAWNYCLRRIAPDGQVSTLAGAPGQEGNADGAGSSARFGRLGGLALDGRGTLYVADTPNRRVCTVSPAGQVRTLARRPDKYYELGAAVFLESPEDVAVDLQGTVYVADRSMPCLLRISPEGQVRTLEGGVACAEAPGPARPPVWEHPTGILVDAGGTIYAADAGTGQVMRVTPDGQARTLAGVRSPDYVNPALPVMDGPAATARFRAPAGLALAPDGTLYVADAGNHRIRRIAPGGQVETVAGRGEATLVNGQGTAARFKMPMAIAVAADGTAYVADTDNHCIRKITPAGQVTILAGTGQPGFVNGAGHAARFRSPVAVAVDRGGVVYVTDAGNHCVRRIAPNERVTTLAGTERPGFANGPGPAARFRRPRGLAAAPDGTLYVADSGNGCVRRIRPDGQVTTLTSPRTRTDRPDGAIGIGDPFALALAASGTLYVGATDERGNVLYAVTPAGRARFVAGGALSKWPEDGEGGGASFGEIAGITVDGRGGVYVAESNMQQIRRVTPAGKVTTVARATGPDDYPPNQPPMELDEPSGIATGPGGTLYVTNWGSNRILVLK
jgi:sugar lactone lactonase YvrE